MDPSLPSSPYNSGKLYILALLPWKPETIYRKILYRRFSYLLWPYNKHLNVNYSIKVDICLQTLHTKLELLVFPVCLLFDVKCWIGFGLVYGSGEISHSTNSVPND